MKRPFARIAAFIVGMTLAVAGICGLETVTHISDLNSSWPLGSDLASTSDDHIRNIKVALKTDFPNINSAVTATPTQLNVTSNLTFAAANLTVVSGSITANSFVPASAGVPVNGMYLPSANQIGFSTNTTTRGNITSTGVWNILAPSGNSAFTGPTAGYSFGNATDNPTYSFLGTGVGTVNGAWTFNRGATLNGVANTTTLAVAASSTSGQSFGITLDGGTTSADYGLLVANQAGTTNYFKVRGDGAIQGGGPVAGVLVDMTPDTGTFTATYTGMTAGVTCTATWSRIGKIVVLTFCAASGTSNATSFTMTGLPSAIQPAALAQHVAVAGEATTNNGVTNVNVVGASFAAGSGTVTFYLGGSSTGWTAANAKGFNSVASVSYQLN